jgi:DNA-binding NarL/FixJ family response regulator
MGVSTSAKRAAQRAASDFTVVATGPEDAGVAGVVKLLRASGISASAAAAETLGAGAIEDADAIVVCAESADAAAELASGIRRQGATALIAVVGAIEPRQLRELLGAGADGVVLEATAKSTLAATVRAVCAGQLVVPAELWQRLARPALSMREKQTLAMVVMGFSNAEIARKLFVTEATVKSHLSSSFSKLGVRSRAEATARILDPEHGLGTGILAISDDGQAER